MMQYWPQFLSFQLEDLLFYEGLQKSEFLSIILADLYTKPSSPFITKFLEVFFFFGKKNKKEKHISFSLLLLTYFNRFLI